MKMLDRYPIFQQAYFVNDLEASLHKWADVFGAGPFSVTWHHRCDTFMYRGTPAEADVSYAFGQLGDVQIQLIEQHDDTPSIYKDLFPNGEEGFHHIGVLVNDFEAEYQRLIGLGFEPACRLFADGVDAAYFDTRSLNGCFTEIHGDPPHILATFAAWRRAHELRRDGDPAINRAKGSR